MTARIPDAGPHAVCPITDLFVAQCLHCRGGTVYLYGDTRCGGCSQLLERGTDAHQTPAPESAILCPTCHDERSSE